MGIHGFRPGPRPDASASASRQMARQHAVHTTQTHPSVFTVTAASPHASHGGRFSPPSVLMSLIPFPEHQTTSPCTSQRRPATIYSLSKLTKQSWECPEERKFKNNTWPNPPVTPECLSCQSLASTWGSREQMN